MILYLKVNSEEDFEQFPF